MSWSEVDVAIVGGGISGSALLYTLAGYTDLSRIVLLERKASIAASNSDFRWNSQTLHCGDIETNYSLEKALKVKRAANLLANYTQRVAAQDKLVQRYQKMVLAVGEAECAVLQQRFERFAPHFPYMHWLDAQTVAQWEPSVAQDRHQPIAAMGCQNEISTIDFGKTALSMVQQAQQQAADRIRVELNAQVEGVTQSSSGFEIRLPQRRIKAKAVVFCAGGFSLLFAKQMGYGDQYSCLPVAGSFFHTPEALKGKVYTIQNDKLPFAAVHGDPDLAAPGYTRFGPTATVMPMLERFDWGSITDFIRVFKLNAGTCKVLLNLVKDSDIRKFMGRNSLYEIPILRRHLFAQSIRKIIPSMPTHAVRYAQGMGGMRVQLIDTVKQELMLGESKIVTDNGLVFNMTPSPGASSCLENAQTDAGIVASALQCSFNEAQFKQDLD